MSVFNKICDAFALRSVGLLKKKDHPKIKPSKNEDSFFSVVTQKMIEQMKLFYIDPIDLAITLHEFIEEKDHYTHNVSVGPLPFDVIGIIESQKLLNGSVISDFMYLVWEDSKSPNELQIMSVRFECSVNALLIVHSSVDKCTVDRLCYQNPNIPIQHKTETIILLNDKIWFSNNVNDIHEEALKRGDQDSIQYMKSNKDTLSRQIMCMDIIGIINYPKHFVVEERDLLTISRRVPSGKIPRDDDRPKYTVMKPMEFRRITGLLRVRLTRGKSMRRVFRRPR
jgi:hypothetical protein